MLECLSNVFNVDVSTLFEKKKLRLICVFDKFHEFFTKILKFYFIYILRENL